MIANSHWDSASPVVGHQDRGEFNDGRSLPGDRQQRRRHPNRLYQRIHALSFGPPDPDLGQARVASGADGTLVGIRKPLAAHEQPIMRTYLAVEDIQKAVKNAEEHGATIAYPPTRQGKRGTFAIVIQADAQHGLWQR
jgi:predicted enzyme related to lactoylglutathione lyase